MNIQLIELLPAMIIFCLISTITPGPNNLLLAHSSAHFGIKKTLPHVLGIRLGMTSLHITILLGLGELFQLWPIMHKVCTVIAAGYIIYMAVKIAFVKRHKTNDNGQPMSIRQAALFQMINPKSWATLITGSSVFTLTGDLFWPSAILGVIMFNIATLPGTFMWITIGKLVSHKLQEPRFNRIFNILMGALLLTTVPMILI